MVVRLREKIPEESGFRDNRAALTRCLIGGEARADGISVILAVALDAKLNFVHS